MELTELIKKFDSVVGGQIKRMNGENQQHNYLGSRRVQRNYCYSKMSNSTEHYIRGENNQLL